MSHLFVYYAYIVYILRANQVHYYHNLLHTLYIAYFTTHLYDN